MKKKAILALLTVLVMLFSATDFVAFNAEARPRPPKYDNRGPRPPKYENRRPSARWVCKRCGHTVRSDRRPQGGRCRGRNHGHFFVRR